MKELPKSSTKRNSNEGGIKGNKLKVEDKNAQPERKSERPQNQEASSIEKIEIKLLKTKTLHFWRSRKGYYISNILHAGNIHNGALKTQSKTRMWSGTMLSKIRVPP